MELELKNFETVFHVAIVFNFIYTVESFSERITLIIHSPAPKVAKIILAYFSKIVQRALESNQELGKYGGRLSTDIQKKFIETDKYIKDYIKDSDFTFNGSFKASYLFAALYSLFILILSGYDGFLTSDALYHALFVINIIVLLFHVYVLYKTFRIGVGNIKNGIVSVFFISIVLVFYFLYKKHAPLDYYILSRTIIPSNICTISFTVALTLCPFISHLLRAFLDIIYICCVSFQVAIDFMSYLFKTKRERKKIRNSLNTLRENLGND